MTTRENTVVLKQRVEELEKQVNEYKQKLENLRKAKNTTVTKREREILEVRRPSLGQRSGNDAKIVQLQKDVENLEQTKKEEIERIKKQVEEQISALQLQAEEKQSVVDDDELERLRAENTVLKIENDDLKSQVENLHMELSIKEAEWCDREEQFKRQSEMSGGEKYAEWMAKTEQKIEELRHANGVLRQMLNAQTPSDD